MYNVGSSREGHSCNLFVKIFKITDSNTNTELGAPALSYNTPGSLFLLIQPHLLPNCDVTLGQPLARLHELDHVQHLLIEHNRK